MTPAGVTSRSPIPLSVIKKLSRRSDRRGLCHLAGHLAAIGGAAALVLASRHHWTVWPAMMLLGVLEMALFTPLHETTHRTPFRSLWLNRVVGWVAGFILLLPPEGFRLFHLAHHRHTHDPEHDPELRGARPLTLSRYLVRLTGLPYWWAQARLLVTTAGGCAQAPWIPASSRRGVVREARIYLGLYAGLVAGSVYAGPMPLLLLWVVPALLGQPVLRAVLMAEHEGCPFTDDLMANTRTTLAGRAFALLFWNANLHAEHHLAPGVPFHALPDLHDLLRPHLRSIEEGYAAAHRSIMGSIPSA